MRIERACRAWLDRVSASKAAGILALLVLVLATNLPGLSRLPPVDRTEVVYAESSRQMLTDGRLTGPTYLGEHERHRPIGTFWLQMAAAELAGPAARDSISTYRIPSLLGVLAAVLATYLLLARPAGHRVAWGAAALTAISPVASLQAHLAITESITFGAAAIAELTLLRIYVAAPDKPKPWTAMLMWIALGLGIALNALAVPVLLAATLITLYAMDRDAAWLRNVHAAWGVPLMLLLASPWPVALVMAEGANPFAGMSLNEVLNLLGGSQAMKLRAWPGTFTLGFILACFPALLLLLPAVRALWGRREQRLERYLIAWLAGYLVYLELISSKPALYTVQVMLPAAMCAVMLQLAPSRDDAPMHLPERTPAWPGLVFAAAYPVLVVVLHCLTHTPLTAGMVAGALVVAALLALPAFAARAQLAAAWLVTTVIGFAAFLVFTFAVLLPSQKSAWTTEVIREAVAPLQPCGDVAVVGYREPSAVFTFGAGNVFLSFSDFARAEELKLKDKAKFARYFVAEDASVPAVSLRAFKSGCIDTFNVTRGCVQRFTIYDKLAQSTAGTRCSVAARYRCDAENPQLSAAKRCK